MLTGEILLSFFHRLKSQTFNGIIIKVFGKLSDLKAFLLVNLSLLPFDISLILNFNFGLLKYFLGIIWAGGVDRRKNFCSKARDVV